MNSTLSQILIAAIAGGVGALILPRVSKLLGFNEANSRRIQIFGVIAIALISVKIFNSIYENYEIKESNKTIDSLITESAPNATQNKAEVIQENSIRLGNEQLSNASSRAEKEKVAASQFIGYYFVNRVRNDYCSKLGVPLTNFTNEFNKQNELELAKSRKILNLTAINEEEFYKKNYSAYYKILQIQMSDQSKQLELSEKNLCNALELGAEETVKSMKYSVLLPAQSKILVDSKY
jgi:hypothetical protein